MHTQPRQVRWGTLNARYGRQVVVLDAAPFSEFNGRPPASRAASDALDPSVRPLRVL